MGLARIRKAIVAGAGTAVGTCAAAVVTGAPHNPEGWVTLVASAIGAGVVTALATYRVRNAGSVNGSDPGVRVRPGRPPR